MLCCYSVKPCLGSKRNTAIHVQRFCGYIRNALYRYSCFFTSGAGLTPYYIFIYLNLSYTIQNVPKNTYTMSYQHCASKTHCPVSSISMLLWFYKSVFRKRSLFYTESCDFETIFPLQKYSKVFFFLNLICSIFSLKLNAENQFKI